MNNKKISDFHGRSMFLNRKDFWSNEINFLYNFYTSSLKCLLESNKTLWVWEENDSLKTLETSGLTDGTIVHILCEIYLQC